MKRKLSTALAILLFLTFLSGGSAFAQPKGAIQLGAGMATVNGGPMFEVSWDVFTLHAAGMYFPAPWAALILDFSYGLPHEYEMKFDTGTNEFTAKSSYLDLMAGACKHFAGGGFLYAGAGLAVGWSDIEVSQSEVDYEIETGIGLVFGAGAQIPISNAFMGFFGMRQRYISTDFKSVETTVGLNAGGFEMVAGISWALGG